jgi:hypothetical protein
MVKADTWPRHQLDGSTGGQVMVRRCRTTTRGTLCRGCADELHRIMDLATLGILVVGEL